MASPLISIRFDRTNPEAKAYAQKRSAKLVTDVSAKTRAAVRTLHAAHLGASAVID